MRDNLLRSLLLKAVQIALACSLFNHEQMVHALTANQAVFEFRPNGLYRVYVHYTVPALKEFRESYIEFTERKKAETFYFNVLRGADFYLDDPDKVQFVNKPLEPTPW